MATIMPKHEACSPDEVFVGNTDVTEGIKVPEYLSDLKTARLGKVAYPLYGPDIPRDQMRPLFIGRSEERRYSDIMEIRTFGRIQSR